MGISIDAARVRETLQHCPYHFAGIRAVPAMPPSGPVFPLTLGQTVITQFWQALNMAKQYWPEAVDFEIVGSNNVLKAGEQSLTHPTTNAPPPEAVRLQTPASLLTFRIVV